MEETKWFSERTGTSPLYNINRLGFKVKNVGNLSEVFLPVGCDGASVPDVSELLSGLFFNGSIFRMRPLLSVRC